MVMNNLPGNLSQLKADKYFENVCFLLRDYSKRRINQAMNKISLFFKVRNLFVFIHPILK